MIEKALENRADLQEHLFVRGFLVTEKLPENMNAFPFYGNWSYEEINGVYFMTHAKQKFFSVKKGERTFFLLGHAYNPFTMEPDENKVLEKIAASYDTGKNAYYDAVDEVTGLFVLGHICGGEISFLIDPSGMQSGCYGNVGKAFYLSSHPQLIADICGLEMDGFVKELVGYKWYNRVMGPYLPSDLTPFQNIKRIVPNIEYDYKNGKTDSHRFFPRAAVTVCKDEREYTDTIASAADILKNNMKLIAKKWAHPQISLTGGIDSNTTFAAANGNYEKFEAFSYISAPKEVPDTEAAKKIAQKFGVKHTVYQVPDTSDGLKDYDKLAAILKHNNGYIGNEKENELRKRVVLRQGCPADVEVKSWVSETIRGYWYKHYGRKTMPKLSPKLFRNLYKIFICNRSLAHKIDKLFAEYIDKFEYKDIPAVYPPADMHYWEVTWGSWGGMNISEMRYCFDITMAYNNRKFLDLMFKVPLEKRICDQHHLDMKKYLNKDLYDMNIRVVNLAETDSRAFMLNVLFTINSILPF